MMNKPPTWYYLASVVATVWAMIGCYAYLSQVGMSAADMAGLPTAQRQIWAMTPAWVTGAYAIAVWGALIGALCLLARSGVARIAYVVSLAAVVVQFGWTFLATPILKTVGPGALALPGFIAVAGVLQIWLARAATKRGWLR